LEDAGAAAITMYSLFEEQIMGESHLVDHYLTYGTNSYAEASTTSLRWIATMSVQKPI
jgi:dihydroorotate dehydrogenase (fumarate)